MLLPLLVLAAEGILSLAAADKELDSCPLGGELCGSTSPAADVGRAGYQAPGHGGAVLAGETSNKGSAEGGSTVTVPRPRADLITQELQELEELLRLNERRIELVEELRNAVHKGDLGLSEAQVRALRAEIPRVAEVANSPEVFPVAAAEDYLTSKAVIKLETPAALIKFLPLRAPRSPSSSQDSLALPLALLVAAQTDGRLGLYASSGEKLASFEAGHEEKITVLAVSPSWATGDTLIATGDSSGIVRVHRVVVKQRKGKESAGRIREDTAGFQTDTQYLGATVASSVHVVVQFQRQLEALSGIDGDIPDMTALVMASQHGSKYFVVGDAEGKISVFTITGAFRSRMDATLTPGHGIESFYVHMSQLLFRAGPEWGYIDLEKLEVKHVECPDFDSAQVTATIIDSQHSFRVLTSDKEGVVSVLAVRNARTCWIEHRFPRGLATGPLELASIRGFVLGLEQLGSGADGGGLSLLTALNMSHAGMEEHQEADLQPSSPVAWRRRLPPARAWAVYRHRQDVAPVSDLLAFLSEDGMDIEILELLMHLKIVVPQDPFWLNGWVTLPIAIGIVLIVVFWHYLKYGRVASSSSSGSSGGSTGGSPAAGGGDAGITGVGEGSQ